MLKGGVQSQLVGSAATVVQICPSSAQRVHLLITIDKGVGYVSDNPGKLPGTGLVVTPQQSLSLDYELYGDPVRHAWYGDSTDASAQFGFLPVEDTQVPTT